MTDKLVMVQKPESQEHSFLNELELGEYFFHVFLIETSNLSSDSDLDIIIKVECFQQHRFTKVVKGLGPSSNVFLGDNIFFEKKFDSRDDLENSFFRVSIFKHNSILKNELIGFYENSLLHVYKEDSHCLLNSMNVLVNPEKDPRSIMGYIKLSASFNKVNQSHMNLERLSIKDDRGKIDLPTIPPQINIQFKQMVIKLVKGRSLCQMDIGGSTDAYVKFKIGGHSISSSAISSSLNPVFNEMLYIPVIYPSIIDKIIIKVKDKDTIGKNETIGSLIFRTTDILAGSYRALRWHYIYGGPENCKEKEKLLLMNNNPGIASALKGSVMMGIDFVESESPRFTFEPMTKDKLEETSSVRPATFNFRIDLVYVQNLQIDAKEIEVVVNWGHNCKNSFGKIVYQKGVLIINKSIVLTESFDVNDSVNAFEQIPDVILTLVHKGDVVAFYRISPRSYPSTPATPCYEEGFSFRCDPTSDLVQYDRAGTGFFKIGFYSQSRQDDVARAWPSLASKLSFEKVYLLINLVKGMDIAPFDSNSASDPIAHFYHLGSTMKSSNFFETLNPSWNEQICLETYLINNHIPLLFVSLADRDADLLGDVNYEFIGTAPVELSNYHIAQSTSEFDNIKPEWVSLSLAGVKNTGKVLLGVKIVKTDFVDYLITNSLLKDTVTLRKDLPLTRSNSLIKITLLGLRELESSGVFKVRSVAVKINTSSLQMLSNIRKGVGSSTLTAYSKTGGSNPNIGSTMCLRAELPTDMIYIPSISFQVLGGSIGINLLESLIGTTQISLSNHFYLSNMLLRYKLRELLSIKSSNPEVYQKLNINEGVLNSLLSRLDALKLKNKINIDAKESDLLQKVAVIKNLVKEEVMKFVQLKKKNDAKTEETCQNLEPVQKVEVKTEARVYGGTGIFGNNKLFPIADKINALLKRTEIVIVPVNGKFVEIPDPKYYILLGYKTKSSDNRHYRLFINKDLETSYYMSEEIYNSVDICKGKRNLSQNVNFLSRIFKLTKNKENHKTGSLQYNIEIINEDVLRDLISIGMAEDDLKKLSLPISVEDWKLSKSDPEIKTGIKVKIDLYIISATYFTSEDTGSENDSYIEVLYNGKTSKSEKVINNSNNPKFYESFTFDGELPGASSLEIKFMDHDFLNPDDLIGKTTIDLERRFFDKKWRDSKEHPIEERPILHPSSRCQIGNALMWVDINPIKDIDAIKSWDINPRPATEVELRLVVWDVVDMPTLDMEDTSDLFVSASLPNFNLSQRTDVHYRSQTGFGSFNWRIIFKMKIDHNTRNEMYKMSLRVFDRDIFAENDFAADAQINFEALVANVLENEGKDSLSNETDKSLIIKVPLHVTKKVVSDLLDPHIRISLDVVSKIYAEQRPVGLGRDQPNQEPFLPPPEGRVKFSLNPITMFEQLFGPRFRRQCCCYFWMFVIIALIIVLLPIFISTLISTLIARSAIK